MWFVKKKSKLDEAIDALVTLSCEIGVKDDNFPAVIHHLELLMELKSKDKSKISSDTMAMVVGNLAGILIIVGYERAHVLTSRGLSFIKTMPK